MVPPRQHADPVNSRQHTEPGEQDTSTLEACTAENRNSDGSGARHSCQSRLVLGKQPQTSSLSGWADTELPAVIGAQNRKELRSGCGPNCEQTELRAAVLSGLYELVKSMLSEVSGRVRKK